MQDPFDSVKEDVIKSMRETNALYERFTQLLQDRSADTAVLEELEWTRTELQKNLNTIDYDIEDLEETISIVERDKQKYQVNDREIRKRKDFVIETKKKAASIKEDMRSPATMARLSAISRERNAVKQGKRDKFSKLDESIVNENSDFIASTMQDQQTIMRDQDQRLDEVDHAVQRIGHVAVTVRDELDAQDELLDRFESNVDTTTGLIKNARRRMMRLLENTSDRGKIICIVILVAIIAALVVFLFAFNPS